MSIFIARGDNDTLGPYTADEAAKLLKSGFLLADDLAAHEGDATWVPLASLLEAKPLPPRVAAIASVPPASRAVRLVPFAVLLFCALGLVGGVWVFRNHRSSAATVPRPTQAPTASPTPATPPPLFAEDRPQFTLATPAVASAKATPAPSAPPPASPTLVPSLTPAPSVIPTPSPTLATSPTPVPSLTPAPSPSLAPSPTLATSPTPALSKNARLSGTVSLPSSDGSPVLFGGVRVRLYPLDSLATFLAKKKAQVDKDLARLDPQIEAAAKERNARHAEAEAALQAFKNAAHTDPMLNALRFAATQTRNAAGTAADDYRYLLGERKEALDGERYFRELPPPAFEAETDPAGAFVFDLHAGGPFVLAVKVNQTGGSEARSRYWLVQVAVPDGGQQSVSLSEKNVSFVRSDDSLLQTVE